MAYTETKEAYQDISIPPVPGLTHVTWVQADNVEVQLGAAVDGKAVQPRRGLTATFDIDIPTPFVGKTIEVTKAKLTMIASQTTTAPSATTGYKISTMERDGAWDGSQYPTDGDTERPVNQLYAQEHMISIKVGVVGDLEQNFTSYPNTGPDVPTAIIGRHSTPAVELMESDSAFTPVSTGEVVVYFESTSSTAFDTITVRMGRSAVGPPSETIFCQLFELSTGMGEVAGGVLGAVKKVDSALISSLATNWTSDFTFTFPSTYTPVSGTEYALRFFVSSQMGDGEYIGFMGPVVDADDEAHATGKIRTGYSRDHAKGWLAWPLYTNACTVPTSWLTLDNMTADRSHTRMTVTGTDAPINVTAGDVVVWGNSDYSPDFELDLASLLQDWIDAPWYETGEYICLCLKPYGLVTTTNAQVQWFHSVENATAMPHLDGPVLEFEYTVTQEGWAEWDSETTTDLAPSHDMVAGLEVATETTDDFAGSMAIPLFGQANSQTTWDGAGSMVVEAAAEPTAETTNDFAGSMAVPLFGQANSQTTWDGAGSMVVEAAVETASETAADIAGSLLIAAAMESAAEATWEALVDFYGCPHALVQAYAAVWGAPGTSVAVQGDTGALGAVQTQAEWAVAVAALVAAEAGALPVTLPLSEIVLTLLRATAAVQQESSTLAAVQGLLEAQGAVRHHTEQYAAVAAIRALQSATVTHAEVC
jgi:hypothetical protein